MLLAVGAAAALLLSRVGLPAASSPRPLPSTDAEWRELEGQRVKVDSGTTADGRIYSIEVSVSARGDYCDFVKVEAPAGGGDTGGGGCGPGSPMSYSFGSDGIVHGITDGDIASVEVVSAVGRTVVATKPLPSEFNGHRHFVALLPAGTQPTEFIGKSEDGAVVVHKDAFGR